MAKEMHICSPDHVDGCGPGMARVVLHLHFCSVYKLHVSIATCQHSLKFSDMTAGMAAKT